MEFFGDLLIIVGVYFLVKAAVKKGSKRSFRRRLIRMAKCKVPGCGGGGVVARDLCAL